MANVCKCRNCGKMYDPYKSRCDYTGYCSQSCFHEKAKRGGYKKFQTKSEYDVLKQAGHVGNINKFGDRCDYLGRKLPQRNSKEKKPLAPINFVPTKEIHLACKAQVDTDDWEPVIAFEKLEDAKQWVDVLSENAEEVNERLNSMTYEFSVICVQVVPDRGQHQMGLEQAYKTLTDEREAWFKSLHPAKELPDGNS